VTSPLDRLHHAFENRVRLGVMSALAARDEADFTSLRELLGATDGNLATHLAVLERLKFIRVRKVFSGRKPVTSYSMTEAGRKAFMAHIDALEHILKEIH
jgi:DNA-binding MarR family transcriptional regulator